MNDYKKPLPIVRDENRSYWQALKKEKVSFISCVSCGQIRLYSFRKCPACGEEKHFWKTIPGTGTIWTIAKFHQVYFESFKDEVPYNVIVVQLDQGPKIYSNLIKNEEPIAQIGDRVEPVFDPVTDEVTLLKFRLILKCSDVN